LKEAAAAPADAGEALASVVRSLTITRKMLNEWRNAFRAEGLAGLGSNVTL
jgi:transposase-like protein